MNNEQFISRKRTLTVGELCELRDQIQETRAMLERIDLYTSGNPILHSIEKLSKALYLVEKQINKRKAKRDVG